MKLSLLLVVFFAGCALAQDAPYSKLMIVNGDPFPESQAVEVIDLENPLAVCFAPASYPTQRAGTIATIIDGQVTVCGGYRNQGYSNCNAYNPLNDTWNESVYEMTRDRDSADGIMISDTEWWVTGGFANRNQLNSTETLISGEGFTGSIELPTDMDLHHVIKLNETHLFIVGGYPHDGLAFYFDYPNQQFIEAENMFETKHATYSGLVTRPSDGTQYVVVTGGYDDGYLTTTEIFDLATGTWTAGTRLPIPKAFGASVQYGDTFIVVGGAGPTGPQGKLYMFDNEEFDWIEMPQTLQIPRREFSAILVPDSMVECS